MPGSRGRASHTGVANDSEEPGAAVSAGKCPKVSKGSQRRLLHDIFRIRAHSASASAPADRRHRDGEGRPRQNSRRSQSCGRRSPLVIERFEDLLESVKLDKECKVAIADVGDVLPRRLPCGQCGRASEPATTHSARTGLVRRPYSRGSKMKEAMKAGAPGSFGAQLKALREAAGFTQEELATIAGLSVHAVSALERGRTTAAPCRDRAGAVRGSRPDRCDP